MKRKTFARLVLSALALAALVPLFASRWQVANGGVTFDRGDNPLVIQVLAEAIAVAALAIGALVALIWLIVVAFED
jgi:hypothetical protein